MAANISWNNLLNTDTKKPQWYMKALQPQVFKHKDIVLPKTYETAYPQFYESCTKQLQSRSHILQESVHVGSQLDSRLLINPYIELSLPKPIVHSSCSQTVSKSLQKTSVKTHDETWLYDTNSIQQQNSLEKITASFGERKKLIFEDTFCQTLPLDLNWDFPDCLQVQQNNNSLHHDKMNKILFINYVCATLISAPNFENMKGERSCQIYSLAEKVVENDPEFVLKLALYTRQILNVRSTSNFLLACAAHFPKCRPHLEKYFYAAVVLPSDWIDVAEKYKICFNSGKASLPSALRKCLVKKFADFDEYQLAKYNKDKKAKKSTKVSKTHEDKENGDRDNQPFNLKKLIRLLHITKPAYNVMCILGKKYPTTIDMFYANGLTGTWKDEFAGTRMKLKIPITWETQVSLKGNTSQVWQDLLDSKAVPYMATLRNIRNMIKAGISIKHHDLVLKHISNRNAVAKSRQFPFRFLSAYEVLEELLVDLHKLKTYQEKGWSAFLPKPLFQLYLFNDKKIIKMKGDQKQQVVAIKHGVNKKYNRPLMYDESIVERYKKAIGMALDISTSDNLTPIRGRTLVFCNVSETMRVPCSILQKGSKRMLHEIALLLGLMCYSSSEHCTMLIYGQGKILPVEIEKGGILSNLTSILKFCDCLDVDNPPEHGIWKKYLDSIFVERSHWDQIIILSNKIEADIEKNISNFLSRYRALANRNAMFYNLEISGKAATFGKEMFGNPKNVKVCGFSDRILHYIAKGGEQIQLFQVENIDRTWHLNANEQPRLPAMMTQTLPTTSNELETIKVFISSTLKDMTGERDVLTKLVFPELRKRAFKLNMDVVECDFTWGIPNVAKKTLVKLCLNEIEKCSLFVGLVGDRYGWTPSKKDLPTSISNSPTHQNKSITELEIYKGLKCHDDRKEKRVFLYLRDEISATNIPKKIRMFFDEPLSKKKKLSALRKRIIQEKAKKYTAEWVVSKQGNPVTSNLTQFTEMLLSDLWKAMCELSEEQKVNNVKTLFDKNHSAQIHLSNQHALSFVGRQQFIKYINEKLHAAATSLRNPLQVLVGSKGCGKTSILAKVANDLEKIGDRYLVLKHFIGFTPNTEHDSKTVIDSLSYQLQHLLMNNDKTQGQTLKDSIDLFMYLLKSVEYKFSQKVVVVLDGMDSLLASDKVNSLQWLQLFSTSQLIIFLSCNEKGQLHSFLKQNKTALFHKIPPLHGRDSALIVRKNLSVYSKKLNEEAFDNQLQKLLLKAESKQPIYLKIACEYLRLFGKFSTLDFQISNLPGDVRSLLQHWLNAVETFLGLPFVIEATLCIIYCLPCGIEIENLFNILNWITSFNEGPKLERSQFKQILHLLDIFFCQAKTCSNIFFRNEMCSEAVFQRYFLAPRENRSKYHYHKAIAFYHLLVLNDNTKSVASKTFSLSWLPYHVCESGEKIFLMELLKSTKFVQSKCYHGCIESLLADIRLAMKVSSCGYEFDKLYSCVQSFQALLQEHPVIISQCLTEFGFGSSFWDLQPFEPVLCLPTKQHDSHCIATLQEMVDAQPSCLALSTSGSKLACGSNAGILTIFTCTGERIQTIHDSTSVTDLIYVTEDFLLSGKADGKIRIWNDEGGVCVGEINAHKKAVVAICFSLSSSYILSIGLDKVLNIWKVLNLNETFEFESTPLGKHTLQSVPNCIDLHPKQLLCAIGLWNAKIQIWNYITGKIVAILHGCSSIVSVKYSTCGKYLYSSTLNSGALQIWSSSTGYLVTEIETNMHIKSLCNMQKYNYIVASGNGIGNVNDGTILVWSGSLGRKIGCFRPTKSNLNHAMCCSISTDYSKIAVGFWDQKLIITDMKANVKNEIMDLHQGPIRSVCWSSQKWNGSKQEFVATCSDDKLIKLTISTNLKLFCTLEGHTGPVLSLACCKAFIASASEDFSIILWSFNNILNCENKVASPTYFLRSHSNVPTCISFNESETMLVSGAKDKNLVYWNVSEPISAFGGNNLKAVLTVHNAHSDWITACSWSTSSEKVVSGSNDCSVKIWLKDNLLMTMQGHEGFVSSVCWQADYILSTDNLGLLTVWSSAGIEITSKKLGCQINGSSMVCKQSYATPEECPDIVSEGFADYCVLALKQSSIRAILNATDWFAQTEYENWKKQHDKQVLGGARKRLLSKQFKNVVIATVMNNGMIETWYPLKAMPVVQLSGHLDEVSKLKSFQSTLYSCSQDKTVKIWKLQDYSKSQSSSSDKLQLGLSSPVTCISVKGPVLVTGCTDGVLEVWNIKGDSGYAKILRKKIHNKEISGIEFLPEIGSDYIFCTCGFDGYLKVCKFFGNNPNFVILSSIHLKFPITMISVDLSNHDDFFGGHFYIGNTEGELLKIVLDTELKLIDKKCLDSSDKSWYRFGLPSSDGAKIYFLNDNGHFFNHDGFFHLEDGAYITTVAKIKTIIVGDSSGNIYFLDNDFRKKIHASKISYIGCLQDLLITTSLDKMIKIWKKDTMKQVGFYEASSGITHAWITSEGSLMYSNLSGDFNTINILSSTNFT